MGMKKACSCGYWNEAQQECLYAGSACIRDDERKKPKMTVTRTRYIEEELLEIMNEAFSALYHRIDTGALDSKDPEDMKKAEQRKAYCVQAYKQMRKIIQKPEVTKEWIEKKAKYLYNKAMHFYDSKENCNDFIRTILKEIQGK